MSDPVTSTLAKAPEISPEHPWLGLSSFTEETAGYFFGRDQEIRDLHKRILHNPLTILYGQSGLGKTSLLGAGLIPRLKADSSRPYSPIIIRLRYEKEDPPLLTQTRKALSEATGLPSITAAPPGETLWETFHRLPLRLDHTPTPAILFDQFEEIFTLGQLSDERKKEAREWLVQIADLIENRAPSAIEERLRDNRRLTQDYDFDQPPLRIVLTLREDFLSHLEQWKPVLPSLMENRMPLHLLDGPRALEAVTGPANLGESSLVTREVASRIVRTAADVPDDTPLDSIGAVPPILSLLCEQLNLARLEHKAPRIEADLVSRESEKILQDFYEKSFTSFPHKQREAIRELIEDKLVTTTGHRAPFAWDDAEAFLKKRKIPDPQKVFRTLVARRLITIEEKSQHPRLEITHDVLTPIVSRSRKERHARLAIRKKIRTTVFALVPILIVAGLAFTWTAQNQAHQNDLLREKAETEREIAETSRIEQEKQKKLLWQASEADCEAGIRARSTLRHEEALAYFERGYRYAPNNLRNAWQAIGLDYNSRGSYKLLFQRKSHGSVSALAFFPDGSRIATGSKDGTLRVFGSSGQELWKSTFDGPVTTLAVSPNGSRIAAGSWDMSLLVLNSKGKELWKSTFEETVNTLAFSPDGSRIAAGSDNDTLRIFDSSGRELWNSTFEGAVTNLTFSPDRSRIVAGSADNTLRAFDFNGQELWKSTFEEAVTTLAFSPDGSRIAAGFADSTLHVFDPSGQELWKSTFDSLVTTLAFSPDGSRIAASSEDDGLRVFDSSGKEVWPSSYNYGVTSFAFSSDGSRICTGSDYGTLSVLDSSGQELWSSFNFTIGNRVTALTFSTDGSRIAAGSEDGTLQVFDSGSQELWKSTFVNHVTAIAFSYDGSRVVASSDDNTLRVFDSGGRELWKSIFENNVSTLAVAPDGLRIAAGSKDNTIRVFDFGGTELWRFPFRGPVSTLAFSPDGTHIAVGSLDHTLRVFDSGGTELWKVTLERSVTALAFSPNGMRIAAGSSDRNLRVFDFRGQERWKSTFDDSVTTIAFSRNGSRIAAGSADDNFRVFDSGGQELWKSTFDAPVTTLAFSSDGSRIAAGSEDDTLRVFDLDGQELWRSTFEGAVTTLAFSPDGSRIAAGSWDRNLRVFGSGGQELWESTFEEAVTTLAFSPDGSRIAAGFEEGTLRILDLHYLSSGNLSNSFLLSAWIAHQGLSTFDSSGRLATPNSEQITIASKQVTEALQSDKTSFLHQYLRWRFTDPIDKTLSPYSNTLLRNYISQKLRNADIQSTIISAHSRAPWHPLAPLSLARLLDGEEDQIHKKFLCELSLERLKDADQTLWGGENLANDTAFAAEILLALELPILAQEAAILSQEHYSNPSALSTITQLSSGEAQKKWQRLLLNHPKTSMNDLYRAAYAAARDKNLSHSQEFFKAAHERFPDNEEVFRIQGWSMINLGNFPKALEAFQKALALSETPIPHNYLGLAICYHITKQPEKAIASYAEAIGLDEAWASEETITASNRSSIEKDTLLFVFRATLKKHPELAPKKKI